MYAPSYDVIVVGGGVVGAAAAEQLARRGQRVLLLEQGQRGHTRGSSHGDGRIIRKDYPEAVYMEMVLRAYPAWKALGERVGHPLMAITGGWDCGPADSPFLAESEENFRHFSIPYERLSAAGSNRRFPQFHLPPGSEALFQPEAGVLFATPAVRALWTLAEAGGARAIERVRVTAIEPHGNGVTVRAGAQVWEAARVVIAAGGWSGGLVEAVGLTLPLVVTQEQVAFFAAADGLDHGTAAMPVFIDYHLPRPFYGLPQIEVPGVKVGWHHTGQPIDPDVPRPFDEENLDAVRRYVQQRLPHLDPQPIERLTCLYTNTPDYHFVLDRHPAWPQIIIGTGFSGHGFKFAPVLGEILAALALDEPPPVPLDTFRIGRLEGELARRTNA